jgi:phosphopantetheinyl transferase
MTAVPHSITAASALPAGPQVWLAPRLDESRLAMMAGLTRDDEHARCNDLKRISDRERFLTGRLLARQALSHASGETWPCTAWSLIPGPNGKPYVAAPDGNLQISIAHSADMVAVAVSPFHDVGIDVERMDGAARIEPSVLSDRERRVLAGCRDASAEFIRLWTMKEAYAKRTGAGVGMDFAALDLDWVPDRIEQRIELGDCTLDCRTVATSRGTYSVALAWTGGAPADWRMRDAA